MQKIEIHAANDRFLVEQWAQLYSHYAGKMDVFDACFDASNHNLRNKKSSICMLQRLGSKIYWNIAISPVDNVNINDDLIRSRIHTIVRFNSSNFRWLAIRNIHISCYALTFTIVVFFYYVCSYMESIEAETLQIRW